MELISAKHPEILSPVSRSRYGYAFISFTVKEISFNVQLAKKFNINHHDDIFFVAEDNKLYFYQCEEQGGFHILSSYTKRKDKPLYPLRIRTRSVLVYFKRKFKMDLKKNYRYYVQQSEKKYKEHPLIEILMARTIDEMGVSKNHYSFLNRAV